MGFVAKRGQIMLRARSLRCWALRIPSLPRVSRSRRLPANVGSMPSTFGSSKAAKQPRHTDPILLAIDGLPANPLVSPRTDFSGRRQPAKSLYVQYFPDQSHSLKLLTSESRTARMPLLTGGSPSGHMARRFNSNFSPGHFNVRQPCRYRKSATSRQCQ